MTTGRIAVITDYGKPFELREYDVPDPEPGAVVIRVGHSGLLFKRRSLATICAHSWTENS